MHSLNTHIVASALSPRLLHGLADDAHPHLRVEGTAVVVDISGFTTLSEQLAAAGREGTEQLIATISRIFTVLLPATDDGGDILKFAGDALFFLFQGKNHAKHAAHAAWNMNKVLTAIGDIHLPAARAKLRMSVGVHSGTFEVLLTGGENVSAILTGAATTRVLQLQDAAEAGKILVSAETAALLPAAQVVEAPGVEGAFRLTKAGSVAAASLMALTAGRTSAADRFLPRAFAQRPDLLDSAPDHRWAALAFVQVGAVPGVPDADDLQRMTQLTALVEQTAAETGVTLLDVDPAQNGYRYFLTAGAPTAVEDPEGRLITAALRIVSADTGYTLRAGIASGRVFAGFVGAHVRQTYTVMGDPTNLAARLTARAEPGTVLVARTALERTARPFETADGGTVAVKGKKIEIPVAIVTDDASGAGEIDAHAAFVGRIAELARLRAVVDEAADGRGTTIVITGPAGIGKSRLVARALDETGLTVLRVHGDRYGSGTPYRALSSLLRPMLGLQSGSSPADAAEALREAVAARAPELEPWLALIAPAVRAEIPASSDVEALDDAFRAERTVAVLADLVAGLSAGAGCLVVDDAQWIDPASAAVLEAAVARDQTHAILVARRDEAGGFEPEGDRLALGGMSDDDAGDLIEAVAGRRLLPADLAPLVSRGQGVPLYLIELAAGIASDNDALGIEQLIGERIDALTEADRTTLRHAAVLGTRIPLGLFITCVGMPMFSAELSTFLELGADAISFRSELFRDVAYDQLTFQTRRDLHRAAAAAITANPAMAGASRDFMLAAHYEAAGDWDEAQDAASRAAEAAEKAFALEEAVKAYRVAVESARKSDSPDADLSELLQSLGRVSLAGGWAAEGLEAFSAARKLITDAVARARLDRERAYALNILGRAGEAVRTLRSARRALSGLGDDGDDVLAALAVTEAGLRLRQGRWADAETLSDEAIGLLSSRADDTTRQRVLADAYRYHDIAASEQVGDAGMVHLQQALELYTAAGDELSKSKVLSLLGVRAYYRGDWTMAAMLYGQARTAAEAAGDVVGAAIEAANAAEILVDQGRVDEARPLLKGSLRVFEASDNPYLVAFTTDLTGRAAQRAGDLERARALFAAAAAGYTDVDEADAAAAVRVRVAEAALDSGDAESARTLLDEAGDTGPRALRQRARIALTEGDATTAAARAAEAASAPDITPLERALSLALLSTLTGESAMRTEATAILSGLGVANTADILDAAPLPPSLVESSRS